MKVEPSWMKLIALQKETPESLSTTWKHSKKATTCNPRREHPRNQISWCLINGLLVPRTVGKQMSVVEAMLLSVLLCYGSPSGLRHSVSSSLTYQSVSDLSIQNSPCKSTSWKKHYWFANALSSTLVQKQELPVGQHWQSILHRHLITKCMK